MHFQVLGALVLTLAIFSLLAHMRPYQVTTPLSPTYRLPQSYLLIVNSSHGERSPFGVCSSLHVLQRALEGDTSERARPERTWAPFNGDHLLSLFGMVSELHAFEHGHARSLLLGRKGHEIWTLCNAVLHVVLPDTV